MHTHTSRSGVATPDASSPSAAGEPSAVADRRHLRPRRTVPAKNAVKRPRFQEITLAEGDEGRILGRRIKVYWPLDKKWYYGHIKAFNSVRKQHRVVYDDNDKEWLNLHKEVFKLQVDRVEGVGHTTVAPVAQSIAVHSDSKSSSASVDSKQRGEAVDASTLHVLTRPSVPEGIQRRKHGVLKAKREDIEDGTDVIEDETPIKQSSQSTRKRRKKTDSTSPGLREGARSSAGPAVGVPSSGEKIVRGKKRSRAASRDGAALEQTECGTSSASARDSKKRMKREISRDNSVLASVKPVRWVLRDGKQINGQVVSKARHQAGKKSATTRKIKTGVEALTQVVWEVDKPSATGMNSSPVAVEPIRDEVISSCSLDGTRGTEESCVIVQDSYASTVADLACEVRPVHDASLTPKSIASETELRSSSADFILSSLEGHLDPSIDFSCVCRDPGHSSLETTKADIGLFDTGQFPAVESTSGDDGIPGRGDSPIIADRNNTDKCAALEGEAVGDAEKLALEQPPDSLSDCQRESRSSIEVVSSGEAAARWQLGTYYGERNLEFLFRVSSSTAHQAGVGSDLTGTSEKPRHKAPKPEVLTRTAWAASPWLPIRTSKFLWEEECMSHFDTGRSRQLGAYFGTPSILSLLRVSRDAVWWIPLNDILSQDANHVAFSCAKHGKEANLRTSVDSHSQTKRVDLTNFEDKFSEDLKLSSSLIVAELQQFPAAVSQLQSEAVAACGGKMSSSGLSWADLPDLQQCVIGSMAVAEKPKQILAIVPPNLWTRQTVMQALVVPSWNQERNSTVLKFGWCLSQNGCSLLLRLPDVATKHVQELYWQVSAFFGEPGILSLLRVSKDYQLRYIEYLRRLDGNDMGSVNTDVMVECQIQSPRVHVNEELGGLDERMLTAVHESTPNDSVGASGERSVKAVIVSARKAGARSGAAPLKKGRRTGKGVKRGFVQVGGDTFDREDVSPAENMSMSNKPLMKRSKVETEIPVACTGIPASTHSPYLDVNGAPATCTTEKYSTKVDSTALRVNILKLRRCPINNGLWLVAGNSCTNSQDRTLANGSAKQESSSSLNSRHSAEVTEPVTPYIDVVRKRSLDACSEVLQRGRDEQAENSAPVAGLGPAACSAGVFNQETNALRDLKVSKTFSLNTQTKEVWLDMRSSPTADGTHEGLETRKRRKKGYSPTHGDDSDPSYRSMDMGVSLSLGGHYANSDAVSDQPAARPADLDWCCHANVLVMGTDRCWREVGAIVELQAGRGNSWMLSVSVQGECLYSHKAEQFVATGTTNRYTHAMIWRGSKSWSLEFVDRKQWQLFKEMHEECFQRNARAASVRHIPIPGVKPIQDCAKLQSVRFVRPPSKYIHQFEGEVDMALASDRVVYDMDSEDEEWLAQVNGESSTAIGSSSQLRINEDTLEIVVDLLEKKSFKEQHDSLSADMATELCQAYGSVEVIRTIHSYWLDKRQRKGMALIRLFQPAPWEQYQKQVKDWEVKISQLQEQSPTASKQQLQTFCKRPPLFAFCLRPRGLESRNKMQKQRSHRKYGLSGSASRQWTSLAQATASDFYFDTPSKRSGIDAGNGPFYGSRKLGRQRFLEEQYANSMPVDLADSFEALAGDTFVSSGGLGQGVLDGTRPNFTQAYSSPALQVEKANNRGYKGNKSKKLGRKARKMKLLAAAEESRRKRQLRGQQGHVKERFLDMVHSPRSLSEAMQSLVDEDFLTPAVVDSQDNPRGKEQEMQAAALSVIAGEAREKATALRARAQALYAVADAAMHKAMSLFITADAIHAAQKAVGEVSSGVEEDVSLPVEGSVGNIPLGLNVVKDDTVKSRGRTETPGRGASFGSWRRALHSTSQSTNHAVSKGASSKPGLMTDADDPLLPVASWSQELGAGLGTRLLQTGDGSPPRQRYSPALEGLPKSPSRGVRGESLLNLGRTRQESMVAMLTR